MTNEEKKLQKVIAKIYERSSGEVRIHPAWLATEAMAELDTEKTAPPLVYLAAHLQLRQIARSICRTKAGAADTSDGEQHDLFPDLQFRYPSCQKAADGEPTYVLLDYIEEQDVRFNCRRLRKEGQAKLKHADALEAWWADRIKTKPIDGTAP